MTRTRILIFIVLVGIVIGCGEDSDNRLLVPQPLDPYGSPSTLNRQLGIDGSLEGGDVPESTTTTTAQITNTQPSASLSAANILFIPFAYSTTTTLTGVYLQIVGSDAYWDIPIDQVRLAAQKANGTYVLSVGIPDETLPGEFSVSYSLHDATGDVGNTATLPIEIVPSSSTTGTQDFPPVSGNDGLTIRSYDLGSSEGAFSMTWTTYQVPDRIDIRHNGQWIASTGTILPPDGVTPTVDCSTANSGEDGFVGASGTFTVNTTDEEANVVDVYVSGCLNGGTAWDYSARFEVAGEPEEPPLAWHEQLPPCPCTYAEAQAKGDEADAVGNMGTWSDCGTAGTLHFGATNEVRWLPNANLEPGQQCTYDADGNLITGGIAAGTPDLVSPHLCGIRDLDSPLDPVNSLAHSWEDVYTFHNRPCHEYLRDWPPNTGQGCNTNAITPITGMLRVIGNMTCPDVIELIGEVQDSTVASTQMKEYIVGDAFLSESVVISQLRAIRDECDSCDQVSQALRNLGVAE